MNNNNISAGNNNVNNNISPNGNNNYRNNGKTMPQSPVSVASAVSSDTNSETQSISDEQQAASSAKDRKVMHLLISFLLLLFGR